MMRSPRRMAITFVQALVLTPVLLVLAPATARAQGAPAEAPYVVEYYYKARWGFAAEFIELFRKNHFPVLKKDIEAGRILEVTGVAPRFHGTEDGRWDYRVTIVFKNAAAAVTPNPNQAAVLKQLYPDQAAFQREEQRRFEILEAHWDVPIVTTALE